MKRITLTLLAVTLFSAVIPQAKAELGFDFDFNDDSYHTSELVYERLNRNYQGRTTLPLRQILNLVGPRYRGREITQVILRASTAAGHGTADLEVNGRVVDRQQVGRRVQQYVFQLPRNGDEIGEEIQQLQLELQGNFYVEGVGVRLERDRGPGRGPGRSLEEVIRIDRRIDNNPTLYLDDYVNLDRYNGLRLNKVTIRASTKSGRGDIILCTSSCETKENIGTNVRDHVFYTGGDRVNNQSHNWNIKLGGNFYIDRIVLEFSR